MRPRVTASASARRGLKRLKVRVLLAVTGTPGTGKKSVATPLASLLTANVLDLNSLIFPSGSSARRRERSVDVGALRARLLKSDISSAIVVGHLVPDVLRRNEPGFVAVLRCEPSELKKRLLARGYSTQKVIDNVEAELIGVVLDSSVRAFGAAAVHEYDTTGRKPAVVAKEIARDFAGATSSGPWTDWTLDYDSSTKLRSLLSKPRTEPAST